MLADKLQDLATANLVIDEVIKFSAWIGAIPSRSQICIAYESTVDGSPLRTLIRNMWVCTSKQEVLQCLRESGYPPDFLQDIAAELVRAKVDMEARLHECDNGDEDFANQYEIFSDTYRLDSRKCLYHQHDEKHPKCYRPKKKKPPTEKKCAKKAVPMLSDSE